MNFLSLVWIALMVFPLVTATQINEIRSAESPGKIFIYALFSLASLCTGYLTDLITDRMKRKSGMSVYVMIIISGLAAAGIYFATGKSMFFFCLLLFVMYLAGVKAGKMPLTDIIRSSYVVISSFLYFFTAVSLNKYMSAAVFSVCFMIPYIFMIFLWFFLCNYSNLNRVMSSRNYDERYLPAGIRKYNAKTAAVLCIAFAFLVMFYRQMMALINIFLKLIVKILKLILSSGNTPEVIEEEITAEETAMPPYQVTQANGMSEILQIILIVILLLAAAVIIIYAARNGVFTKLARGFTAGIRKIFENRRSGEVRRENCGFHDVYESIADETDFFESVSDRRRKQWKEKYKRYADMPDSTEKLRFGYGLAAEWIKIKNPSVSPSDTPLEISDKINIPSISEGTETYCKVRYGKSECDSLSISRISAMVEECRKK